MRKSIFVVHGSRVLEADHGLKFLSQISRKLHEKSQITERLLARHRVLVLYSTISLSHFCRKRCANQLFLLGCPLEWFEFFTVILDLARMECVLRSDLILYVDDLSHIGDEGGDALTLDQEGVVDGV